MESFSFSFSFQFQQCRVLLPLFMKTRSDAQKRTLALQERALRFSTGVNLACPNRFTNLPSATIWRQLVRAADSVSSNLIEADDASSTADFLYKIQLTLRETKESRQSLQPPQPAETRHFLGI